MKTTLLKLAIAALLSLPIFPLQATTIQKLTFEEMVKAAELIIDGEVDNITMVEINEAPYTRVLLKVHDVLKGDDPGEFIELDFLGGNLAEKSVRVSGQDIPEEGEKGFYFIERPSSRQVNPLVGWSQGHFRIRSDLKGNEYLETDIKQETLSITDNKNAAMAAKLENMKFSKKLVEKAYFSPVTPDELRDAVSAYLP